MIPTGEDLSLYSGRPEIIKQVSDQIVRDFEMAGLEIVFSPLSGEPYKELFSQLYPALKRLAASDRHKLIALLYRIDLSEDQIGACFVEEHPDLFCSALTGLVLKRELQKVVLRLRWSGH